MLSPSKPGARGRGEQVADVGGAQAERVEVDQPVEVAQPERVGLALVQRGAERRTDARRRSGRRQPVRRCRRRRCTAPHVRTRWLVIRGSSARRESCADGRLGAATEEVAWPQRRAGRAPPRRRPHPGRDPRRGHRASSPTAATPAPGWTRSPPDPHHEADDLLLLRRQGAALHRGAGAGLRRHPGRRSSSSTSSTSTRSRAIRRWPS